MKSRMAYQYQQRLAIRELSFHSVAPRHGPWLLSRPRIVHSQAVRPSSSSPSNNIKSSSTAHTSTTTASNDHSDISESNENDNANINLVQEVTQRGQSALNSFFHETSRRSQRIRRRQAARLRRRQQQEANVAGAANDGNNKYVQEQEDDWVDNRTVWELIFPRPTEPPPTSAPSDQDQPKRLRPTLAQYWQAMGKAWAMYRGSWRGFWTSGIIVRDPTDERLLENDKKTSSSSKAEEEETKSSSTTTFMTATQEKEDDDTTNGDEIKKATDAQRRTLKRNVRRNTKMLRKTALQLREQVRKTTGIRTADDFRRVAAEVMKLVSECLQEFLAGYRQGRDGQVKKMIEEDLRQQQVEQAKAAAAANGSGSTDGEDGKPPRRRRRAKRRVLKR